MTLPAVSSVDVAGVPAFVVHTPDPLAGQLIFGVGLRDETAPTAGTAHLIEHLVMSRVGKVSIPHNARTDDETISFFAQGAPDKVADFLSRVSRAIVSLHEVTDDDVAEQRRIIAAELGEDDELPGRGALLDRFGAQSLGLLDVGTPGHRSITREQALAFADAWLHTGNAVLVFSGDVPDALDISLPPARALPPRTTADVIRGGAWVANGPQTVVVSLVLRGARAEGAIAIAGATIAGALHEDLRTHRQLIYSVAPFDAPLDRDAHFVAFALDARSEDALAAATYALETLRRLAESGISDEQHAQELEDWWNDIAVPASQLETVEAMAISVLRSRRERSDLTINAPADLTRDVVRQVIADAIPTVFVTFGDQVLSASEAEVSEALGLPFVDLPQPLYSTLSKAALMKRLTASGVEVFNAKMFRGMRGAQFVIDHDRIAWVSSKEIMEIPFDDVALAMYSEARRSWAVLGTGGDLLVMERDQWRSGDAAHALLSRRLPAERQIRVHLHAT
ncbi:hypothetical protein GCM10009775_20320 [Microbacterium aoyamense]|uniref:Peptidase M16 C-terminal domain-containing protein n=1 Tax=Microbacterium aoyamense TaxID=344166 RepID=A0ABP5B1I7_9MICO|nr:insulinase family protein [Microbacterium aoyamense]